MACVAEYPLHHLLGEPPKKRRKLTSSWDILPSGQKAQQILDFIGQPIANGGGVPSMVSLLSRSDSSSELSGSASSSTGDVPFRYVSPPRRNDDKEGHYQFALGDNLTPRYKILRKIGEGTFGQVLECWDRESKDHVAIKVTRGLQKYREEALIEIDVLREVAKYNKSGKRSRSAKYFRHGTRLDWPDGAPSRESIRAVRKLLELGNLIRQYVDDSTGLLIDLLQGLLKFEPLERLTAREALGHPFFCTEDSTRKCCMQPGVNQSNEINY